MEWSRDEAVGSVVVGLEQPFVIGCSLGWEFWRCAVSISDSILVAIVETPVSPIFFFVIIHHERVI